MRLLGNYDVIYDETYSVIDEVITRKFRASMEPFCDLKFSKNVEQLTYTIEVESQSVEFISVIDASKSVIFFSG